MAPPRKGVNLQCIQCGGTYYLSPSRAKGSVYCSRACKEKHKASDRKEIICKRCGKEFVTKQDHGKWPKYCSRECFTVGAIKPTEKECPVCGVVFLAARSSHTADGLRIYCSDKCKNEGSRKINEFVCECCGRIFVRSDSLVNRNRFCSRKCTVEIMRRERGTSWKGGKYKDETTNTVRVLLRSREKDQREFYQGEHRIIAGQAIGRMLKRGEPVLHINKKNDDNHPGNLFICENISEMRYRFNGKLPWPKTSNLGVYGQKTI